MLDRALHSRFIRWHRSVIVCLDASSGSVEESSTTLGLLFWADEFFFVKVFIGGLTIVATGVGVGASRSAGDGALAAASLTVGPFTAP